MSMYICRPYSMHILYRYVSCHLQVLVGDPTSDFKKRTQELILKDKQEKALWKRRFLPSLLKLKTKHWFWQVWQVLNWKNLSGHGACGSCYLHQFHPGAACNPYGQSFPQSCLQSDAEFKKKQALLLLLTRLSQWKVSNWTGDHQICLAWQAKTIDCGWDMFRFQSRQALCSWPRVRSQAYQRGAESSQKHVRIFFSYPLRRKRSWSTKRRSKKRSFGLFYFLFSSLVLELAVRVANYKIRGTRSI